MAGVNSAEVNTGAYALLSFRFVNPTVQAFGLPVRWWLSLINALSFFIGSVNCSVVTQGRPAGVWGWRQGGVDPEGPGNVWGDSLAVFTAVTVPRGYSNSKT